MRANDLVINLNLLFIELEVNNNYTGCSYYRVALDESAREVDILIDEKLDYLKHFHNHPEWLMQ